MRTLESEPDDLQDVIRNARMTAFDFGASGTHPTGRFSGSVVTASHLRPVELSDALAVDGRASGLPPLRLKEGSADVKVVDWEGQCGDSAICAVETSQERCRPSSTIARKPLPALSRNRQSFIDTVRMNRSTGGETEG